MRKIVTFSALKNITDESLIQLIGETEEMESDSNFSNDKNQLFIKRSRLCQLLNDLEFTIENYGIINFFIEYEDQIPELAELALLLEEFQDKNTIIAINKALEFYKNNQVSFDYLKSDPDDYDDKYDELNERFSSIRTDNNNTPFHIPLNDSIRMTSKYIRKYPDEFYSILS